MTTTLKTIGKCINTLAIAAARPGRTGAEAMQYAQAALNLTQITSIVHGTLETAFDEDEKVTSGETPSKQEALAAVVAYPTRNNLLHASLVSFKKEGINKFDATKLIKVSNGAFALPLCDDELRAVINTVY